MNLDTDQLKISDNWNIDGTRIWVRYLTENEEEHEIFTIRNSSAWTFFSAEERGGFAKRVIRSLNNSSKFKLQILISNFIGLDIALYDNSRPIVINMFLINFAFISTTELNNVLEEEETLWLYYG